MVLTFSGRDSRRQFWPLPIFLYIASIFGSQIFVTLTMMSDARASIIPDMRLFATVIAISAVIAVLLLAAAVTRRLHDTGRSGWWGLMPLPFLAFSLAVFPRLFDMTSSADKEVPDNFFPTFGLIFANNVIYIILLVVLITLLCLKSSPGDNRFGPPPEIGLN